MATIIKHKQFNNHIYKTEIAGRPFSLEFGKVAELANASAMVKYGDTSVLVAVTASPRPRSPPKPQRRHPVPFPKRIMKPAHTRKPTRKSHLAHRQPRLRQ